MWQDLEVTLKKATPEQLRQKPDESALGFGVHFTDHMFTMAWNKEHGWHDAQICPFQDFTLNPACTVFHYGQAIFEGLKAYRGKDDQIFLFRPQDNFERMNNSALRMCMPRFPLDKVVKSLKAMLYLDREWIPREKGATLYIRPTMIGTDPTLGVKSSASYLFYIIMSPVGAYYAEGFSPTKIYVTEKYARAVPGGVGEAKTAGNYAASLKAAEEAKKVGCTQVLWLDGCEHKYIEEVGTSNIFCVIGDELVTPPLGGTILGGITRDSVLQLAADWGLSVKERAISINEVLQESEKGDLKEIFATGTAAVISPVGELHYQDRVYVINEGKVGSIAERLYTELQEIQFGYREDSHRWVVRVC